MASKTLTTIAAIFLCIILFPVMIGLAGGLFGAVMGIFGAIIGAFGAMFGAIIGAIGGIFGWIFGGWHIGLFHWHLLPLIVIILIVVALSRQNRR